MKQLKITRTSERKFTRTRKGQKVTEYKMVTVTREFQQVGYGLNTGWEQYRETAAPKRLWSHQEIMELIQRQGYRIV